MNINGIMVAGDLAGSSDSNVVVSISGSSPINITPNALQWANSTIVPVLGQMASATAAGQTLTIQSQGSTGSGTNGGNLVLASGNSVSGTAGNIQLQSGTITNLTLLSTGSLQFGSTITSPTVTQVAASAAGGNLSITAQSAGGTTNNGGSLVLTSGSSSTTGTSGNVTINTATPGGGGTAANILFQISGTTQAFVTTNASGAGLGIGSTPGTSPTITSGSTIPSSTEPNGSIYLNTSGATGSIIYTRQNGAWSSLPASGSQIVPLTETIVTNASHSTYTIDSTSGSADGIILHNYTASTTGYTYIMPAPTAGRQIIIRDITGSIEYANTNGYITGSANITTLAGTFTTNATTSVSATNSQTFTAGQVVQFSNQVGTNYSVATTASGATMTLTSATTNANASGLTVTRVAATGLSGTFTNTTGSNTVTATNSQTTALLIGSSIIFGNQPNSTYIVSSVSGGTTITLNTPFTGTGASGQVAGTSTPSNVIFIAPHAAESFNGSSGYSMTGTSISTTAFTTLTGSSTLFTTELAPGMSIVFSSQPAVSYTVTAIASATSCTITPAYSGTTASGASIKMNSLAYYANNGILTLVSNGTNWFASSNKPLRAYITASAGLFIPSPGCTSATFIGCGGGGGGGGGSTSGAGGGGGGALQSLITVPVTPNVSSGYSITIGSGGNGGGSSASGSSGSATIFGTLAYFYGASGGGSSGATSTDIASGGYPVVNNGNNIYSSTPNGVGSVSIASSTPITSTTLPGMMAMGGGGGQTSGNVSVGFTNIMGNGSYAGGTVSTTGGGGGGAGPQGSGGAGATGTATGTAAAANTGAGGGGASGNQSGGTGGSGYLYILLPM